ncbi:LacI family DNA-binding transcriptional regulator [Streptomyces sp. NPDC004752]
MTAQMVATRAGTSVSTVSLVVNGKDRGRVSEAIKERVLTAVEELGYTVDHTASALAKGRGDLVIFVAPDLNPFFAEVTRGIREALGDQYKLLVSVPRGQPSAEDVASFLSFRPAGMLVEAPSASFVRDLPNSSLPMVLLDAPDCPGSVVYDFQAGISALAAHLVENGHRTLVYLDTTHQIATFDLRRALLEEAATAAGLTILRDLPRAELTIDSAAKIARAHLPRWRAQGATAVITATDTLAYGVLAAAAAVGLEVPTEIAVAGFDDLPSSSVVGPPLTAVSLPAASLGKVAASRLLAMIAGSPVPELTPLPTGLVVRASTGTAVSQQVANRPGATDTEAERSVH